MEITNLAVIPALARERDSQRSNRVCERNCLNVQPEADPEFDGGRSHRLSASLAERLRRDCVTRLIKSDSAEDLANLFWQVAGYDAPAHPLIIEVARGVDEFQRATSVQNRPIRAVCL